MQEISFYQSHLDRVSRSFAFCIQKLSPSMRFWTSLSYLLCRVLDTIEDSMWPSPELQIQQYSEFEEFIASCPTEEKVREWSSRFPLQIPDGETLLLQDAYFLFKDLHELPASVQSAIRASVQRMSIGMRYYSSRKFQDNTKVIADLAEVNRYCYFVAGIVGELLTRLLLEARPDFKPAPSFLKNAFHFGLFLQKVNLLKDQKTDEKEERHWIPDRNLVLASLRENAIGSLDYLTSLPEDEKGYRTFCGWSLFLGLASLPWIQKAFFSEHGSKIPRSVTEELLVSVEEMAQDNQALRASLNEYLPLFPALSEREGQKSQSDSRWFQEICGDILKPSELLELRMI